MRLPLLSVALAFLLTPGIAVGAPLLCHSSLTSLSPDATAQVYCENYALFEGVMSAPKGEYIRNAQAACLRFHADLIKSVVNMCDYLKAADGFEASDSARRAKVEEDAKNKKGAADKNFHFTAAGTLNSAADFSMDWWKKLTKSRAALTVSADHYETINGKLALQALEVAKAETKQCGIEGQELGGKILGLAIYSMGESRRNSELVLHVLHPLVEHLQKNAYAARRQGLKNGLTGDDLASLVPEAPARPEIPSELPPDEEGLDDRLKKFGAKSFDNKVIAAGISNLHKLAGKFADPIGALKEAGHNLLVHYKVDYITLGFAGAKLFSLYACAKFSAALATTGLGPVGGPAVATAVCGLIELGLDLFESSLRKLRRQLKEAWYNNYAYHSREQLTRNPKLRSREFSESYHVSIYQGSLKADEERRAAEPKATNLKDQAELQDKIRSRRPSLESFPACARPWLEKYKPEPKAEFTLPKD